MTSTCHDSFVEVKGDEETKYYVCIECGRVCGVNEE